MPNYRLPVELKPEVSGFLQRQKVFVATEKGSSLIENVTAFSRSSFGTGAVDISAEKFTDAARQTMEWISLVPKKLVDHKKAPLIDLQEMSPKEAEIAVSSALQVLAAGARALIAGGGTGKDFDADALMNAAFGADQASLFIRKQLVNPKLVWPRRRQDLDLPDIDKLVREGTVNELIMTFARCGLAARTERDWASKIKPIGAVTQLSLTRACGGQEITLTYQGFGTTRPPADANIFISIPTAGGGCQNINLQEISPDIFSHQSWQDSGQLTFTLPPNVSTGCIGFFFVPPHPGLDACEPGSLVTAAGMLQSVLGDQFGPQGVMIGQLAVNVATQVEAGRFASIPCAECQADNLNHLNAGPPLIHGFNVHESGPIHPRGYVTLGWSVENAEHIEIVRRDVPGSENPHKLPNISGPLQLNGRNQIHITCTDRWVGQYVLRVSNANGCVTGPLEASVTLHSGYSDYLVGVAKVDITDRRPDLGMAGFAYKQQKTSGDVSLPLFARAFVIAENSGAPDRKRIAIVVADIWTCTQAVKTAVVERLNSWHGRGYSWETVMIAGTHTHAAPGGYSEYFLYNLSVGGFDPGVFENIVDGIVRAIVGANRTSAPGRIFVNAGELADCGANRSLEAYMRNPEYTQATTRDQWTDREMLLLKFVRDRDSLGNTEDIGALNWYAIHPTSLGMKNTSVSGDNKGWAETQFESEMLTRGADFVAAFGNACAGDVSGNVTLDDAQNKTVTMPMGGPTALGLLDLDILRMKEIGEKQFQKALELYVQATSEVTGAIYAMCTHINMSEVEIANMPGARTWPAAVGVSFGAGSSEDSIAYATMGGTTDIDAGIIEGMSMIEYTLAAGMAWQVIAGWALNTGPAIPIAMSAMLTGVPPAPVLLSLILPLIPLVVEPHTRSYLASAVASTMFPDEMIPPQSNGENGSWSWNIPHPITNSLLYAAGHGAKPIMFSVGRTSLTFTPGPGNPAAKRTVDCPLVPHVLPLQLIKIGQVALAGVPAEFTSTAGRRLKASLRAVLGNAISYVAVSNYTNAYSGYVTTPQEYDAQHYEGASTLYGPHTLAAYIQEFEKLANDIYLGKTKTYGEPAPVPAVYRKP